MIFDFFLEINFNRSLQSFYKLSFKKENEYNEIVGEEHSIDLKNGYCVTLNRGNFDHHYVEKSNSFYWIFGYAYTNKKYADLEKIKPSLLSIIDIVLLQEKYPQNWRMLLKGLYVIVKYDAANNILEADTDFLNMLPLYYSHDDSGKLIISSNVKLILKRDWVDKTPDEFAIGMQHLFDYTLGEYYYVKGIRRMENARTYIFSGASKRIIVHWDVSSLKHNTLLPKIESLEQLGKQLHENVNLYANYSDKALVSLTGGFDGRTNLAVLDKPLEKYKCYSYGMPGSKQIIVPKNISEELGIDYEPILLEQEFLDNYSKLNYLASYFSNGTAPIGFGNIVYAFSKLKTYSTTVVTGLLGSEVLRPLHNNQIQVNDQSFAIFLSDDLEKGIEQSVANRKEFMLVDINIETFKKDLMNFINDEYFEKYSSYDKMTRFFFFILQEGLRKYFSQEISIERMYVTTKLPYFDVDFIELIYQTSWAGIYNGFLGNSKIKRRKGQLLYAYIMKKYKPKLLKLKLDRGYSPSVLLLPTPLNYALLAKGVFEAKQYMKKHQGNDTFKTHLWAKSTLIALSKHRHNGIIDVELDSVNYSRFEQGDSGKFLMFRHLASIKYFFTL